MNCLNCHSEVKPGDKYCANCGQQVDKNDLRLGVLIREFFENYISLDTRFGRSIKPFLFKPGFLTLEFNRGIRKNYANPFRLYILTSILFFSGFSYFMVRQNSKASSKIVTQVKNEPKLNFTDLDSNQTQLLTTQLNSDIIRSLKRNDDSTLSYSISKLAPNQRKALKKELESSGLDSIVENLDSIPINTGPQLNFNAGPSGLNFNVGDLDWTLMEKYRYDYSISDEALLDSMNYEKLSDFNRFMSIQTIRVYRAGQEEVVRFILKNLSIIMFLLIPISGLILQLFFRKNQMKYVEHLIMTVHMHSFSFLLLGLVYFLSVLIPNESIASIIRGLSIIILMVYFFKALKRVYQRSWFSTIIRGILINVFYFFISLIFFLLEVLASFLLF